MHPIFPEEQIMKSRMSGTLVSRKDWHLKSQILKGTNQRNPPLSPRPLVRPPQSCLVGKGIWQQDLINNGAMAL